MSTERPRKRSLSRRDLLKAIGISVPPAKPCKTRQAINEAKLSLPAQPTEAKVKSVMAITNSPRIERARIKKPVSGIAITSAIKYAV